MVALHLWPHLLTGISLLGVTHPVSIEIGMIGVDHGQPPKNALLRVDVAVFTLCEVPIDAP